ncbi:hypothetical protein BLNAU_12366 [Blattamonas nauphoetae]|uniref:Uncharacterized protein n=1 Tax=Blattamonas nauphoetae TaxID=2049346 RepID=A0ABQ9XJV7_9EUKA|nr:hypothetical protein BLNAU_12366 [Blattamonas nauphoetae]
MTALDSKKTSSTDSHCPDCSAFLNWSESENESEQERAVVCRSLVATMKFQPALDESLEAKAVRLLDFVVQNNRDSADAFFSSFASVFDESSITFVQSIVVLISSPNKAIIKSAMKMLDSLLNRCSSQMHLALVKADLIPRLITTLNPLSFSFAEVEDIHSSLMSSITCSLWLSTQEGLSTIENADESAKQSVHKTVLKQVLVPSEAFICHLCANRLSIMDRDMSNDFMNLLARLLHISPYYQPTMDFVLNMPVVLTIPSCLAFFEDDDSIWSFLLSMAFNQQEWNEQGGPERQLWSEVLRMLRMEGICDMIEEKLQNDQDDSGGYILTYTIGLNNLQGTNRHGFSMSGRKKVCRVGKLMCCFPDLCLVKIEY